MQVDLKDIKSYKTKKLINVIRKLTDEQINEVIDSSIIEFISNLDVNTINSIFRNSNANMQNKLWSNDKIQRILILGTVNSNDFSCTPKTIRNLENLNKVIKSQSIKKQIYNNQYFLYIVINEDNIENRFFHAYDIRKVFNGIVESKEFNSLPIKEQLNIIERLNNYTREMLLPVDFRKKYNNIERILFSCDRDKIDNNIMEQLNNNELFFLDYINNSLDNNNALRKYIIYSIKEQGKSFENFFEEIKNKDKLIKKKIKDQFGKYYYFRIDISEKVYHILLNETQDELLKEKLLKYLICCILKNSSINAEPMYNTLKRNLNNGLLTYNDIQNLTNNFDEQTKDLRLMFYLKFNIALQNAIYLYGITTEQLSKLNVKHINKLFKLLEDKTQDELAATYGICIKMYLIFGYERSLEILNGKFGKYNRVFLDNIAKSNVSRVEMKEEGNKYIPIIDKRFIKFMFENPKNNHFINMFNDKDSQLYKMWWYLYNNYDEILEKCHNEITLKKVMAILETEQYDVDRKIITPDNYLLNNNSFLENIVLGNKTHKHNNEVLEEIVKIYSQMKKRIESSIPYVKGSSQSGYTYEVMKLDDPQIFELGYKANCCIRTLDIAHNHLLHAALCRNGRILIIYDKLGDVAAFCPLKRNGNVIIANSIECVDKNTKINGHFISDAFKEAIQKIVEVSKQSNEPINLACMGTASYLKPSVVPFPSEYQTPTIYEKQDDIYKNTDGYHKTLDIVYKDSNFSFENIKSKNPEVSYMDPREEIKYVDFIENRYDNNENAINIINAINYTINPETYIPANKYLLRRVYYTKDWYIAETYQGLIGECLENDYRAKEEFDSYMNELSKEDSLKVLKRN